MRLEVQHIAGPVPVRRSGVVEVGELPPAVRTTVERAVKALRAGHKKAALERAGGTAPTRIPDVGSSSITIVDDDGTATGITFSEAEATAAQANLLKALRPYMRIVPWK